MSPGLPEISSFRSFSFTFCMNAPDFSALATNEPKKKKNLAWAKHRTSVVHIPSLCCSLATSAFGWTSEPSRHLKGTGMALHFLCDSEPVGGSHEERGFGSTLGRTPSAELSETEGAAWGGRKFSVPGGV